MPTGDEQRHRGLGQWAVLDDVDGHVGGEVVDAVEGLGQRDRERLGRGHPDHERPGEPRAGRHRDRVEVVEAHAGVVAGPLDRGNHGLEVGPAGDLGDDAAEAGVLVDTARDGVDEERLPAHDPDPGLVAGGLDAEDQRLVGGHRTAPFRVRRRMWASTPPGW